MQALHCPGNGLLGDDLGNAVHDGPLPIISAKTKPYWRIQLLVKQRFSWISCTLSSESSSQKWAFWGGQGGPASCPETHNSSSRCQIHGRKLGQESSVSLEDWHFELFRQVWNDNRLQISRVWMQMKLYPPTDPDEHLQAILKLYGSKRQYRTWRLNIMPSCKTTKIS